MNQQEYDIAKDDLNPTFLFLPGRGQKYVTKKNITAMTILSWQLFYRVKGRYNIDDVTYTVEEGDVLILNPHKYHQSLLIDKQIPQ